MRLTEGGTVPVAGSPQEKRLAHHHSQQSGWNLALGETDPDLLGNERAIIIVYTTSIAHCALACGKGTIIVSQDL